MIKLPNKHIIVRIEDIPEKTPTGLIIPEDARQPNMYGEVIETRTGSMAIPKGSLVFYNACVPVPELLKNIIDKRYTYMLVKEEDVTCYITPDEKGWL